MRRSRRQQRQIELGIVALGLSLMAIIILGLMVVFYQEAKAHGYRQALSRAHTPASYELEPAPVQDWRPDISHCFAPEAKEKYDELWDCIRHDEKVTSLVTEEDEQ